MQPKQATALCFKPRAPLQLTRPDAAVLTQPSRRPQARIYIAGDTEKQLQGSTSISTSPAVSAGAATAAAACAWAAACCAFKSAAASRAAATGSLAGSEGIASAAAGGSSVFNGGRASSAACSGPLGVCCSSCSALASASPGTREPSGHGARPQQQACATARAASSGAGSGAGGGRAGRPAPRAALPATLACRPDVFSSEPGHVLGPHLPRQHAIAQQRAVRLALRGRGKRAGLFRLRHPPPLDERGAGRQPAQCRALLAPFEHALPQRHPCQREVSGGMGGGPPTAAKQSP